MQLSPLNDIFFPLRSLRLITVVLILLSSVVGGRVQLTGPVMACYSQEVGRKKRESGEHMHHSALLALSAVDIPLLRAQCLLQWMGLLPSVKYNLGKPL